MATGRSDFPNQINNVLCFPGLFRGLLDAAATTVTDEMKIAAAEAIASIVGDDLAARLRHPLAVRPLRGARRGGGGRGDRPGAGARPTRLAGQPRVRRPRHRAHEAARRAVQRAVARRFELADGDEEA
jgi:malate dehydrogenase (oxaloacetate-decarboxylating)